MAAAEALWLTIGDDAVASTRVRAGRMSDALNEMGWSSHRLKARGALGRARALLSLYSNSPRSVVIVQKLLFGRVMLRLIRHRARVLVWECDDALHLGYPGDSRARVRRTRRLVELSLSRVDVVTTTTPLLAEELRPTSRRVSSYLGPSPPLGVGLGVRGRVMLWLGSPSTATNLRLVAGLPEEMRAEGWSCVAIGGGEEALRLGWTAISWSLDAERHWLSRAAVGLMPQAADPWSERKASYKMLEYMAAGVVPVASDVEPARLILDDEELRLLLVADAHAWSATVKTALARRDDLLPRLAAIALSHSVDACLENWLRAVASAERAS